MSNTESNPVDYVIKIIKNDTASVLIPTILLAIAFFFSRYINTIEDQSKIMVLSALGYITIAGSVIVFLGFISNIISTITSGRGYRTADSYSSLILSGLKLVVSIAPPVVISILLYTNIISPTVQQSGLSDVTGAAISIVVFYLCYSVVLAITTLTAANDSIVAGYSPTQLFKFVGNLYYPIAMILIWIWWFAATFKFLYYISLAFLSFISVAVIAGAIGGIALGILALFGLFSFAAPIVILSLLLPAGFGTYYVLAVHLGQTYVEINGVNHSSSENTFNNIHQP